MYIVKYGRSWYCEKFGFEYKCVRQAVQFRKFFEYINNIPIQDALDVSEMIRNCYTRNVINAEEVKSFGDFLRVVAKNECAALSSIVSEYSKSNDNMYRKLRPFVDYARGRFHLVKYYFWV